MLDFDINWALRFFPKILSRLPTTLLIAAVSSFAGLLLGALMALIRIERVPVLRWTSAALVSFLRGTPVYIQLFVVYYGLPMLLRAFGLNIMRADKMFFVLFAYSFNVAGFASEMIRAAVESVPRHQWDAAYSAGLTKRQAYLRIIIPQSVVIALPSAGSLVTAMLHDTALASVMGIMDVLERARSLGAHNLRSLEAYFDVAVLFVVLALLLERGFKHLEKRYTKRGA